MINQFKTFYNDRKRIVEDFILSEITAEIQANFNANLAEAVLYSLNSGGKRLRPVLLLSTYLTTNQTIPKDVLYLAAAVECIHTYSLIHDDLPSMDNDDYRRGVLTCHKKFSEAMAILAGDSLNSFAFYLLSKVVPSSQDLSLHRDLLQLLHQGSGGPGMVSGQVEDIQFEKDFSRFSEETLIKIHTKKTGALFIASMLLGNRLNPNWKELENDIRDYAEKMGLLFQITDDILDEESSFQELGKNTQKDAKIGKLTYPSLLGMEKTKAYRDEIKNYLLEKAKSFCPKANIFFYYLPVYIAERKN
ncbi:MAG: polyprenyl synthetase family protein [Leptospiraceae bacterium]|nr:polyprenyl synthetase family protein [Leptospiraceae bacterium]MCP5493384.1 polyprenyl synthetase family protein [Leptospiraceae bacterium]